MWHEFHNQDDHKRCHRLKIGSCALQNRSDIFSQLITTNNRSVCADVREKVWSSLRLFLGAPYDKTRFVCWALHNLCSLFIGLTHRVHICCGRADSVLDSHTTCPGFKPRLVRYFLLSFRLLTTMTVSSWAFAGVCGRSGKDFPVGSHPRH